MTTPAPNMDQYFFRASAEDFKKIPGSPIAYWVSDTVKNLFIQNKLLRDIATPRAGLATGDNTKFQRAWLEVSHKDIVFDCLNADESRQSAEKWYPCNSGGDFRKWFGNNEIIVNWHNDGHEIRNFRTKSGRLKSRPQNTRFYFQPGVTWTKLSSKRFGARLRETGFIFDDTGRSAFPYGKEQIEPLLALMCSSFSFMILGLLNPSLSFTSGDIANIPVESKILDKKSIGIVAKKCIAISRTDWDSYETSWDFTELPLLKAEHRGDTLEQTYANLRAYWREQTLEMQRLEEENNRIFIEAYGLEDELTPDVPLSEITLTCNPSYRYSRVKNQTEEKLEAMLLADTMREFVSYAVGCMFGRYSLDKPGLILANQGEGIADYHAQVPEPRFAPEEHGVIPILDENWFTNDIVERFHAFLRTTFGEQHFEENLLFVEQGLNRTVRDYFLRTFYNDHERTYKKRPIYWMFSSPKGSFNALIYLHRYRPDTVSVVLNEYLREYAAKLRIQKAELEALSIREDLPAKDRADAEKGIDKLRTILSELEDYERDVLHPLAGEQLEIDLDDGVKANYPKFKTALKKIF